MGTETTIEDFNDKYAKQGGVPTLLELYQQGLSSPDIGQRFGLQGKEIDYYLKRIIGKGYIAYPFRKVMAESGQGPTLENN